MAGSTIHYFTLYVNDISSIVQCIINMFADDVTLYTTTVSAPEDYERLQSQMKLNPLTRKGQYTGHFMKCTENAKASILAATTRNQTNSHSFNLVRPRIKFLYIITHH